MKLKKLVTPFAAALCIFAAGNIHAALLTNVVTFKATVFGQGATTDNGTNTTFAALPAKAVSNTQIIGFLATDTGNTFSKSAKLILITDPQGDNDNAFAVQDGATVVLVTNIMTLNPAGTNGIKSGKQTDTGLGLPTIKSSLLLTLSFDDTSIVNGSHVGFSLTGLGTGTTTDTVPKNGTYTETFKGTVSSMTGEGTFEGDPFVATGSLSISGKGTLSVPVP